MNTKKYQALFAELAYSGKIPRELYDSLVTKIQARGKMTRDIYSYYLTELEKRRLFDTATVPFNTDKSAKTDGTYVYMRPKNPFWHFSQWLWSRLARLLAGYVGGAIVYGVWRVKDRKKLKKLGACITTSNHAAFMDTILTVRATGMQNRYVVAAPYNCKSTLGGHILRSACGVPVPISFRGMRPFGDMLEYAAKKKSAKIHFYAEKTMWIGYRKPRPHQDGAYFYAERLGIPVVPMLYCFKQPKGLRKLLHLPKVVIRIADPVYANPELPPRERKADLAARAHAATVALYEDFYGIPLKYLDPDVTDGATESETTKQQND